MNRKRKRKVEIALKVRWSEYTKEREEERLLSHSLLRLNGESEDSM